MGLTVGAEKKERLPLIPADVHRAVCYGLIDLGTHFDKRYEKSTHKCLIMWELPDVRMSYTKDGKDIDAPRVVSKRYTLSIGEKSNLRKDLQSWRGKPFEEQELSGFDIKNILGNNCMIQIIHTKKDDEVYANIATILPLYKGVPSSIPENPMLFFSMEESKVIPEGIPDWIKKEIMESAEMQETSINESLTPFNSQF